VSRGHNSFGGKPVAGQRHKHIFKPMKFKVKFSHLNFIFNNKRIISKIKNLIG